MNRRKRLGWFQLILGILLVAAGIFTLLWLQEFSV